jgi:hypothetical protein
MKRSTVSSREFGASVDWRGYRVAVEHVCTVEELKCVLLLRKKKASCVFVNINPKEVMKLTKICHGEFGLQRCGDGGEESSSVGC